MLLLKVSNKEYWLIELHYLDAGIGIVELAFAKVSAQGRAEIPEAGFEQGPVDTEKSGGIDKFLINSDLKNLSSLAKKFKKNILKKMDSKKTKTSQ